MLIAKASVGVLLVWISVNSASGQYRPSTAPDQPAAFQCFENKEKAISQLLSDAGRIIKAIRNKDSHTLIEYFHDRGVSLGADHYVTRREVLRQFHSKKGWVYATFFDTAQLRDLVGMAEVSTEETSGIIRLRDTIKSVHDYFVGTPWIEVEAERVADIPVRKGSPLWVALVFRWEHRPPKGVYFDPVFVCTDSGWKFSTFFNTP